MTNQIIIYDTETTGIYRPKLEAGDPSQPHLVQLSAVVVNPDEARVVQSMNLIVKPDGWEIPPEVVDIHGITTAQAKDEGLPEKLVIETFLRLWDEKLLVGHNEPFDRNIISSSIARNFDPNSPVLTAWRNCEGFCTMRIAKPIVQAKGASGRLKFPKLQEAYEYFFGHQYDRAHSANADVIATLQLYMALAEHEGEALKL